MSVKRISEKYSSFYHIDFNDKATYDGTFSFGPIDSGSSAIKSKIGYIETLKQNSPSVSFVGDKIILRTDNKSGSISNSDKVALRLLGPNASNISLLMVYKIEDVWVPNLSLEYVPDIVINAEFLSGATLSLTYSSTSVYNTATFSFTDYGVGFPATDVTYFVDFNLDIRGNSGTVDVTSDVGSINGIIMGVAWDGLNQGVQIAFSNSIEGYTYLVSFVINYLYEYPILFIGQDASSPNNLLLKLNYVNNTLAFLGYTITSYVNLRDLIDFVIIGVRSLSDNLLEVSFNGEIRYFDGANISVDSSYLALGWLPQAAATDFGSITGNTTTYNVGEVIYVPSRISNLDWKELNSYLLDKWKR